MVVKEFNKIYNLQIKKTIMKKSISMGIYAIMFMFITSAVLSSCNSEDEYYENSNYTLASKRMTRSESGGTSHPSPSIMYMEGNEEVEVDFESVRLHFKVEWDGGKLHGSSSAGNITVSYINYDQTSGYEYYYDSLDVVTKVYKTKIEGVKKEGPITLSNNVIIAYIPVRYREREVIKDNEGNIMHDKNGLTMYRMGDVKEKNAIIELCIEKYRIKPDAY